MIFYVLEICILDLLLEASSKKRPEPHLDDNPNHQKGSK
jgi:hypothetical protein